MYLKPIVTDIWKVYAITSERGDCPLLDFLEGLDFAYQGNVHALLADFDAIAGNTNGPQSLPAKKSHTIAEDIWQLTVGRLRVAWFYDGGKMMVCAHGFFKDSQETKKSDKNKAIKMRESYFVAKKGKNLFIEPTEGQEK